MNYRGWALFCDSDIVFLENVSNLFQLVNDKYAVMCVKHVHNPQVMFFNCFMKFNTLTASSSPIPPSSMAFT